MDVHGDAPTARRLHARRRKIHIEKAKPGRDRRGVRRVACEKRGTFSGRYPRGIVHSPAIAGKEPRLWMVHEPERAGGKILHLKRTLVARHEAGQGPVQETLRQRPLPVQDGTLDPAPGRAR